MKIDPLWDLPSMLLCSYLTLSSRNASGTDHGATGSERAMISTPIHRATVIQQADKAPGPAERPTAFGRPQIFQGYQDYLKGNLSRPRIARM